MAASQNLSQLVASKEIKPLPSKTQRKELLQKKKKTTTDTAGPAWYNMPATPKTPELAADIRLITMRSALDPKQHYRKGEKILQGKYLQVGTVIADPTSHFSERLSRRQKGQSVLDTLMKDTQRQQYLKRKYNNLQQENIKSARAPRGVRKPASQRRHNFTK